MPVKKTSKKPRSAKAEILEIPLPARAGDTERTGKKSVPWREDPEILTRIAAVAGLINQNKPSWAIAKTLKISVATAKRDIKRVRELWAENSQEEVMLERDASVDQYQSIIEDAYNNMSSGKKSDKAIIGYLHVIIRARERIDKVNGIGDPIDLRGKGGGPIQVQDIDAVRDKRWKDIEDKLLKLAQGSLANKESNVPAAA